MGGSWLYSIAARAEKVFDFEGKRQSIPVTVDTYSQLVESGKIVHDPFWHIKRNWKSVEIGDEVFIYTGDKNLGIIGFATVDDSVSRDGNWSIRMAFDLRKCRALLRNPVPATIVREWVHFPRGNVISLKSFETELHSRLPWKSKVRSGVSKLPEEVPRGPTYSEGSVQRVLVNRYERDPDERAECIEHHGTVCSLCGFDFVAVYGMVMVGFIHVHHLKLLSLIASDYKLDPIKDLLPVCPNCHAVLHHREPPYSLKEVRQFLRKRKGSA
jgi:hypothetical protein